MKILFRSESIKSGWGIILEMKYIKNDIQTGTKLK